MSGARSASGDPPDFAGMEKIILEAERRGLALHCDYQDLWFSPAGLRKAQADGRFRWGPVNWAILDPRDKYNAMLKRADDMRKEAEEFADEMGLGIEPDPGI
jgi:hypothetical protein